MAPPNNPAAGGKQVGANLSGITVTKEANFSQWYAEVVTKCELVEYYTEVCDILRFPIHPLPLRRETWEEEFGRGGIEEIEEELL
jgi:hypothetical protein